MSAKTLFNLDKNHHYLNCAFLSPLLKSVEKAGVEGVRMKGKPWEVEPEHFFADSDRVRSLFATLIHADDPASIAIMPSVSYGMGTVAANLPERKTGKIVIVHEQFPSNVYPWKRLCNDRGWKLETVHPPEDFDGRGKRWNERILEAIDHETVLVALANVHWADGTRFDVKRIGEQCRNHDAYFVIDGTQSVGALSFDIQKVKPDALICAGYKWLFGPYGLALGYFGERLSEGVPLEEGWIARKDSRDFAGLVNYQDEYEPGAIRFDMGERSNFITLPMMAAALEQVLKWTPEHIQTYCDDLCKNYIEKWKQHGYGFRIEEREWRGAHLFGIRLPDTVPVDDLKRRLKNRNVHVSVRGSAVRVAPHLYNEKKDIQALHEVLMNIHQIRS
ncbi:MAG: aminotransferase class V-fold PLP-dependent enzyme [Balneolaceae bacterium]|nr:aminotransferase class V-fold PLP-dependent enzyme [Balneolaceae bacterium]